MDENPFSPPESNPESLDIWDLIKLIKTLPSMVALFYFDFTYSKPLIIGLLIDHLNAVVMIALVVVNVSYMVVDLVVTPKLRITASHVRWLILKTGLIFFASLTATSVHLYYLNFL